MVALWWRAGYAGYENTLPLAGEERKSAEQSQSQSCALEQAFARGDQQMQQVVTERTIHSA